MSSSVNNTNQVVFKPLQMTPNFSMHLEDKYLPEINVVSNLKVISMKHTRFDVQQLKVINKEHMNTFGDDIAISIIARLVTWTWHWPLWIWYIGAYENWYVRTRHEKTFCENQGLAWLVCEVDPSANSCQEVYICYMQWKNYEMTIKQPSQKEPSWALTSW